MASVTLTVNGAMPDQCRTANSVVFGPGNQPARLRRARGRRSAAAGAHRRTPQESVGVPAHWQAGAIETSRDRVASEDARTRPNQLLLDLFFLESWLNVYAGQIEVRPPAAPTTPGVSETLHNR
jgi:hypothetical protein